MWASTNSPTHQKPPRTRARRAPIKIGRKERTQESYTEGLATHGGPESCVCACKDMGEASTGVHTGQVLSRVITFVLGADVVQSCGRQHVHVRYREVMDDPARSKTLCTCTCGTFLHGNREILATVHGHGAVDRIGKAKVSRR